LFRADLGPVLARVGRFDEARACFDRGIERLSSNADVGAMGTLLCRQSLAEAQAGNGGAAVDALERIERLLEGVGAATRASLEGDLEAARAAVAAIANISRG
jgi:hypothetical protein